MSSSSKLKYTEQFVFWRFNIFKYCSNQNFQTFWNNLNTSSTSKMHFGKSPLGFIPYLSFCNITLFWNWNVKEDPVIEIQSISGWFQDTWVKHLRVFHKYNQDPSKQLKHPSNYPTCKVKTTVKLAEEFKVGLGSPWSWTWQRGNRIVESLALSAPPKIL